MDWNDTFLNEDHLRASFPSHRVQIELKTPTMKPVPPFRLETEKPPEKTQKQNDSSEEKMEVSMSAFYSFTDSYFDGSFCFVSKWQFLFCVQMLC